MAKSKKKKVAVKKKAIESKYNAYMNIDGEIASIISTLAEVYGDSDGDMDAVAEEIKQHISSTLDDVLGDYDSGALEKDIKSYIKSNRP